MNNLAIDNNVYNKKNAVVYDFTTRKPMKKAEDNKYDGNRAGKSCEVYAFQSTNEIDSVIKVLDKHIEETSDGTPKKIACRNKMLFIIGINLALRASDLRTLTWDFFFEKMPDGTLRFRDSYNLRPRKTRRTGKYVKLHINEAVKRVIEWYISMYPIQNLSDFVFESRQGDDAISVKTMWRVIKGAAKEAGIQRPIGSHSMRKTACYWIYHNAPDKNHALVVLMNALNHSSTAVTARYIGITDNEVADVFNGINLGIDMI